MARLLVEHVNNKQAYNKHNMPFCHGWPASSVRMTRAFAWGKVAARIA